MFWTLLEYVAIYSAVVWAVTLVLIYWPKNSA